MARRSIIVLEERGITLKATLTRLYLQYVIQPNRDEVKQLLRGFYGRWLRPHVPEGIARQRFKLLYFVWGYHAFLRCKSLSFPSKLHLLRRFVIIDWHVEHGHTPTQIAVMTRELSTRRAAAGEAVLEAGCWQGGSSCKLSLLCKALGYGLHIYDSFEGVEELTPEEKAGNYDFSGEYSSPAEVLTANLAKYGAAEVCSIHPGWFVDTLYQRTLPYKVRAALIDCDIAKGTLEVLSAVIPALVDDGCIFSHDYHIEPVRQALTRDSTWESLGSSPLTIRRIDENLCILK
jgi:hypothetical protein